MELKIWNGEAMLEKAYAQLAGYLNSKHVNVDYLVTFDLRKSKNRVQKTEWVDFEGEKYLIVLFDGHKLTRRGRVKKVVG
ncbi:hypothetical protein LQZ18_16630 [Lachnospiraceae bacterium ZAX-1]